MPTYYDPETGEPLAAQPKKTYLDPETGEPLTPEILEAPETLQISSQPERSIPDTVRDWLAGVASNRRIAQEEQRDIGDVGRDPGFLDLLKAGVAGVGAGVAAPAAIAAPGLTALSLIGGALGGKIGGSLGRATGESVAPGVGSLGEEAGEFVGEQVGGLAAPGLKGAAHKIPGAQAVGETLRKSGRRSFASLAKPKTKAAEEKLTATLEAIEPELPAIKPWNVLNPRKALERVAEKKAEAAGKVVGETYRIKQPSSFDPIIERLAKERAKNTRVEQHPKVVTDPNTGVETVVDVPARPKNRKLDRALQEVMAETEGAQADILSSRGTKPTIEDVFETRLTADELSKLAKSNVFDLASKELQPMVRAQRAVREAATGILHGEVPGGQLADQKYSAWRAMQKAGQQGDPGTFVERWLLARVLGGNTGTLIGAAAAKPAFWTALSGRSKIAIGRALQQGDENLALQLLAATAREFADTNESEK